MKKWIFIVLLLLTTACTPAKAPGQTLTVGLMPAVDAAPILLATEKGLFAQAGVEVELMMFSSAQERQSALQTKAVDGAMSDLIALATNVDAGFKVKGVLQTDGLFPVLATPGAMERSDVKVALMEVSVVNFLADRWFSEKNMQKVFIHEIPARLAALTAAQADLGIFPEPVASKGASMGLEKHLLQKEGEDCPDILIFSEEAIAGKANEIRAFVKAYDQAVQMIRQDEALAREILVQKVPNIPLELKEQIELPVYQAARLPAQEYVQQVIDWTAQVIKKDLHVTPEALMTEAFLHD